MPSLDIIRLQFTTPLHIGNERDDHTMGSSVMESDAITAAIHYSWNRMGHPEWIPKDTIAGSGFVISSLFPYAGWNNERLFFLPRPYLPPRESDPNVTDTILRKKLKKVRWIDKEVFFKMLSGDKVSPTAHNLRGNYQSVHPIRKENADSDKEGIPFVQSKVFPRANVSRFGEKDTVIYHIERHFFSDEAGLYALIKYDSPDMKQRVEAAFRFLGDEGVGTDRNVGNGKFIPHFDEQFEYPEITGASYRINLGLYCPANEDELATLTGDNLIGYELTKRGGWLSEPFNTWRKKSVYMFREGGCFHFGNEQSTLQVKGRMLDLRPDAVHPPMEHPVWRSGISLFFPCK
jgi:CRISPR type III-A-associated RAMP protein Csm4